MRKGYTLIEVLIVVVIIGILAAIGVPSLLGSISKAKGAEIHAASGTYIRLQEAYVTEHSAVGNWRDIGYVAPNDGQTDVFSYSQGEITRSQSLDDFSGTQIGWSATNIQNLNDCKKSSFWAITVTRKEQTVEFKSTVSAAECIAIVSGWTTDVDIGAQAAGSFDSGRQAADAEPAANDEKTDDSKADAQPAASGVGDVADNGTGTATTTPATSTGEDGTNENTNSDKTGSSGTPAVAANTATGSGGSETVSDKGSGETGTGDSDNETSNDVPGDTEGGGNAPVGDGQGTEGQTESEEDVAEDDEDDQCDAETEKSIAAATEDFNKEQAARQKEFEKQRAVAQKVLAELKKLFDDAAKKNCEGKNKCSENDLEKALQKASKNYDNYAKAFSKSEEKFLQEQANYQAKFEEMVNKARENCKKTNSECRKKKGHGRAKECKAERGNGGWNKDWNRDRGWGFNPHDKVWF